jgi:hypothetical protein
MTIDKAFGSRGTEKLTFRGPVPRRLLDWYQYMEPQKLLLRKVFDAPMIRVFVKGTMAHQVQMRAAEPFAQCFISFV